METVKVHQDINYWKENIDDVINKNFKDRFVVVEFDEKKNYKELESILLEVGKETGTKVRIDCMNTINVYDHRTDDILFDSLYKQFTLKKIKTKGKFLVRNEEGVEHIILDKEPNSTVRDYLSVLDKYVPLKRHRF